MRGVAWTSTDHPQIHDWIERNELPLQIVEQAADRSQMYMPLACDEGNYLLNTLWSPCSDRLLWSVQMLCRRATRDLETADFNESWHDLATAVRIVGHMAAPSVDRESIHPSVALRECFYAIEVLLNSNRINEGYAIEALQTFQEVARHSSYRDESELSRLICLNALQEIAAGKMTLREVNAERAGWDEPAYDDYPFSPSWVRRGEFVKRVLFNLIIDWNAGLVAINEWYDRQDAAFAARPIERRHELIEQFRESVVDMRGDLLPRSEFERFVRRQMSRERHGRLYGELVFALWGSPVEYLHWTFLRDEAHLRLISIGLALAAYRARYEEYPTELSELVPDYLSDLPLDPYLDGPLVYRRNEVGFLLYVVGPNLVDDGGVDVNENDDDFDIVLRIDHQR